MTRVGFYVVQAAGEPARLNVAARLADKAFRQGHRIFINAAGEAQARQLDEVLWNFRPASFLPHALQTDDDAADVVIGWQGDPGDHSDLLINLQLAIPPFFSRFNRVLEVVDQDPTNLAAQRDAWRFYQQRGYRLDKHDV